MKRILASLCACSLVSSVYAADPEPAEVVHPELEAWFTGTLLASPGTVAPVGTYDFEFFLYSIVKTGTYDKHWHAQSNPNFLTISPQLFTIIGITEWMDFQAVPAISYNQTQGESSTHFADLPVGFDFQLLQPYDYHWIPGIKVSLIERIPTGKYKKLDPNKLQTDISGVGAWGTEFDLVLYKLFHINGVHFLTSTLTLTYVVYGPVHVKGLNAYGGGFETHGKVYPGNLFNALFSFEYSFARHWAFAMDTVYTHVNKNRFSGFVGDDEMGNPLTVGGPSSELLSFTPSIEYNLNANLGAIASVWFSAIGRNTGRFAGAIVAFNISY